MHTLVYSWLVLNVPGHELLGALGALGAVCCQETKPLTQTLHFV
jgi:hypothetical protein